MLGVSQEATKFNFVFEKLTRSIPFFVIDLNNTEHPISYPPSESGLPLACDPASPPGGTLLGGTALTDADAGPVEVTYPCEQQSCRNNPTA